MNHKLKQGGGDKSISLFSSIKYLGALPTLALLPLPNYAYGGDPSDRAVFFVFSLCDAICSCVAQEEPPGPIGADRKDAGGNP